MVKIQFLFPRFLLFISQCLKCCQPRNFCFHFNLTVLKGLVLPEWVNVFFPFCQDKSGESKIFDFRFLYAYSHGIHVDGCTRFFVPNPIVDDILTFAKSISIIYQNQLSQFSWEVRELIPISLVMIVMDIDVSSVRRPIWSLCRESGDLIACDAMPVVLFRRIRFPKTSTSLAASSTIPDPGGIIVTVLPLGPSPRGVAKFSWLLSMTSLS